MIPQSSRRSRLAFALGATLARQADVLPQDAGALARGLRDHADSAVARGADPLALSRDVENVRESGRRFVRRKAMLPHVPRSNPDA